MSVILILMIASLTLALVFLTCFIWAVRSGQFEDDYTPSLRVLTEEQRTPEERLGPSSSPGTRPEDLSPQANRT
ncbi:MAG: cbb3-type cytochrome oxidase assembly protein CcoS [Limisphaerales bacterium]